MSILWKDPEKRGNREGCLATQKTQNGASRGMWIFDIFARDKRGLTGNMFQGRVLALPVPHHRVRGK